LTIDPTRRWPLHPQPRKYEHLSRWVDRLAEAYGVSPKAFCRYALNYDQWPGDLNRAPPPDVLVRLETGTGVSLVELRAMSTDAIWRRLMAAYQSMIDEGLVEPS